jgi:hypothetical protein
MVEAMHDAVFGLHDGRAETLVPCPACLGCGLCRDERSVPPRLAVEWRKQHEIDLVTEPEDETP